MAVWFILLFYIIIHNGTESIKKGENVVFFKLLSRNLSGRAWENILFQGIENP
jgi:hypothetical protein